MHNRLLQAGQQPPSEPQRAAVKSVKTCKSYRHKHRTQVVEVVTGLRAWQDIQRSKMNARNSKLLSSWMNGQILRCVCVYEVATAKRQMWGNCCSFHDFLRRPSFDFPAGFTFGETSIFAFCKELDETIDRTLMSFWWIWSYSQVSIA